MAAVYSERYGYEIEFPPTLQTKLQALYESEDWEELSDYIHDKFQPCVDTFHTDTLSFWGAIRDKEEAQRLDKEIRREIHTWLKKYNARKGEQNEILF